MWNSYSCTYLRELQISLENVKNVESLFKEKEEKESPVRVATGDESPEDRAYPVEEAKQKQWTISQAQSKI